MYRPIPLEEMIAAMPLDEQKAIAKRGVRTARFQIVMQMNYYEIGRISRWLQMRWCKHGSILQ